MVGVGPALSGAPSPGKNISIPMGFPVLSWGMWERSPGAALLHLLFQQNSKQLWDVPGMVTGGFILGLGCPGLWAAAQGGVLGQGEER